MLGSVEKLSFLNTLRTLYYRDLTFLVGHSHSNKTLLKELSSVFHLFNMVLKLWTLHQLLEQVFVDLFLGEERWEVSIKAIIISSSYSF